MASKSPQVIGPVATRKIRAYSLTFKILRTRRMRVGIAIAILATIPLIFTVPPVVVALGPVLPDLVERALDSLAGFRS